jgi:hypothetical protein
MPLGKCFPDPALRFSARTALVVIFSFFVVLMAVSFESGGRMRAVLGEMTLGGGDSLGFFHAVPNAFEVERGAETCAAPRLD